MAQTDSVNSSFRMMEVEGSKRVELVGMNYCSFWWLIERRLFLLQLAYQRKITRCLPRVNFPDNWPLHLENHWCYKRSMKHVHKIITTYTVKKRKELKLSYIIMHCLLLTINL